MTRNIKTFSFRNVDYLYIFILKAIELLKILQSYIYGVLKTSFIPRPKTIYAAIF